MLGKLRVTQGRIICFLFLLVLFNLCLIKLYTGQWFSSFRSFSSFKLQIEQSEPLSLGENEVQQILNEYRLLKKSELILIDKKRSEMEAEIRSTSKNTQEPPLQLHFNWKDELPYFFNKGFLRPDSTKDGQRFNNLAIWPDQSPHDRIVNQLMYIPPSYDRKRLQQKSQFKKIYIHNPSYSFNIKDVPNGRVRFLDDRCPVDTCEVVRNRYEAPLADAIIFKDYVSPMGHQKPPNQIWIYYNLESAANSPAGSFENLINWTATYRTDSDLVTPYAKFVLYSGEQLPTVLPNHIKQDRDYSKGKYKKVAWFASNCAARNGRSDLAQQLRDYITVDIYGRCGELRCSRSRANDCFEKLRLDYKFYLSFENSNCKDYITEKLFLNALQQDVIPIVYGAEPSEYLAATPPHSFVHVRDFKDLRTLAAYLQILDHNSTLYNEYFRWKHSGEFINTFFWCRLCAMLHAPIRPKSYPNLGQWWGRNGICQTKAKKSSHDRKSNKWRPPT